MNAIIFFLTLVLVIVAVVLFVALMNFFGDFWDVVEYPLISFDSFLDFYAIAPEKWDLYSMFVTYSYYNEHRYIERRLRFNLIDSIRYKFWRIKQEYKNESVRETRERAELIQELQKDIDNYIQETMEAFR